MRKICTILLALTVFAGMMIGCSIQPESISTQESLTLDVGTSAVLTWEVLPENAEDLTVQFVSSDDQVASVDDSGSVNGIAPGEADITLITANGLEAVVKVTVLQPVEKVECEPAMTLNVGETESMHANVMPESASDTTLRYHSDDDEVASVDASGLVTAIASGKTVITATAHNGITAQTAIKVENPVAEVQLSHSELILYINGTLQLGASVLPEDATHPDLKWASSDEAVVAVDEAGTITAISLGSTNITAESQNGVSAECKVVVINQPRSSGGNSDPGNTTGGSSPNDVPAAPSQDTQSGDNGGGGGSGGGGNAGITDRQIDQAVADAKGYAGSLGFSLVDSPQPGHSIASTAYSDYNAFYRNLIDNVDYIASLFAGEDLSLVKLCIYRSGNSVYVTYG